MPTSSKTPMSPPAPDRGAVALVCLAAWAVPGAGHLLRGHVRKGLVFFVVLLFMEVLGLWFGGRVFPFQLGEPLVFLAAGSEWLLVVPRLVAAAGGFGQGTVMAVTYEYGNTFLICAGLLNALIVLDAYDLAIGRKAV